MFGPAFHERRQRRHLDVGVGVPAEMPVAALVVGEDRIDRGVVEVEHFLAGVAVVVFLHEIAERGGDGRAVALRQEANALIDRLLRLDEGSCGLVLLSKPMISTFLPLRPPAALICRRDTGRS
jgi:hypothetical protein